MKRAAFLAGVATIAAATIGGGQQQEPPASVFVRPLASLLVPGTGQLLAHQDRGAVYLAAEVYLLSRFLQLDHEAMTLAQRYQNLAFDVARRAFGPTRRDTIFEYYEQMERFAESGRYDAAPRPAFVPDSNPQTYNRAVWLPARRAGPDDHWAGPRRATTGLRVVLTIPQLLHAGSPHERVHES